MLECQIETYHRMKVDDVVVIKGFLADKINIAGVRYYVNPSYADTNMLFSLFCAESEIAGDVILSYADILFQDSVLQALLDAPPHDISVVVDTQWEEYYRQRFENPFEEAESLIYDSDGRILEIGESHPSPSNIQAQYIGLIRLSERGSMIFREAYNHARKKFWDRPWQRGKIFQEAYMTDFLQALINEGVPLHAVTIQHGWLEFDTVTDYENVLAWYASDALDRFCSLDSLRRRGQVITTSLR